MGKEMYLLNRPLPALPQLPSLRGFQKQVSLAFYSIQAHVLEIGLVRLPCWLAHAQGSQLPKDTYCLQVLDPLNLETLHSGEACIPISGQVNVRSVVLPQLHQSPVSPRLVHHLPQGPGALEVSDLQ